jgi:hypothetical protein
MTAPPLNRIPHSEHLALLISDLLTQSAEGDETPRAVMQARSRQAARVIATFCAPLASAPVRAEEPTGLCAGRLCDKRWGDGCPDVDPSLETYHLCYTAAGTPCRCSCGSAPPAAAEDADLTALRSEYENVLPLILRPRAHIGVLNYVNALHRERLALLAARDEAREDRDSHQRAAIEAMSAREKADGAWDEAETFIAKLRDPLLHYFGTTDPELLREIWADAAALPTTRRDGA